jgi:hypothetical protein
MASPHGGRVGWVPPDVVIVAFVAEASSNRCTLFLDHGPLVGNRLGSPDVADELLYYCTTRFISDLSDGRMQRRNQRRISGHA